MLAGGRPGPAPSSPATALWDGLASVAIGLLLLVVAGILARANVSLLVGQAGAPPAARPRSRDELAAVPHRGPRSTSCCTMQLGPDDVLVAARVDFADDA